MNITSNEFAKVCFRKSQVAYAIPSRTSLGLQYNLIPGSPPYFFKTDPMKSAVSK